MLVKHAEIVLGPVESPVGGLAIPGRRLRIILRHPPAVLVHRAEVVLRPQVALVGGFAVPDGGQGIVLRHPLAGVVQEREIELRVGISLFGGLGVPGDGLRIVLRNALAMFVHSAKVVLRSGVSLLGQWKTELQRRRIVLAVVGGLAVLIGSGGGAAMQGERDKAADKESCDPLFHRSDASGTAKAARVGRLSKRHRKKKTQIAADRPPMPAVASHIWNPSNGAASPCG